MIVEFRWSATRHHAALVTVRTIVAYIMLQRKARRKSKSDSSIATGSETRNLAADLYGEALI